MAEKENKRSNCSDIYDAEIHKRIKTLKRFREIWLRSSLTRNNEIFQYADPDFYFYRFAISRQEASTKHLLIDIIFRMLQRYGIPFKYPKIKKDTPFDFIISSNEKSFGYRFSDFYSEDDVNNILRKHKVYGAYIIRTWKKAESTEWIQQENNRYKDDKLKLRAITLEDFFVRYFSLEEYRIFINRIEEYLKIVKEITGYQSIKFLSSMNLATQKIFEEKLLCDFPYKLYKYQIIDKVNDKITKKIDKSNTTLTDKILAIIKNNYLTAKNYRTMIGINEYAESFITSEWLFHSLKGKLNFDFTSIISGYLKSIEQLLYKIVMINVDNGCKIAMSSISGVRKKAKQNGIITESVDKYPYIDLIANQVEYMDSSIGTFEYFLRKNPHIFIDSSLSETIADMISCFRTECRNGYFHTHNLNNWDIVEKTRSNAIYLYFILLGACIIPEDKRDQLGILDSDKFDVLCMKIREFKHYNIDFIFEYSNGRRIKLIYDSFNNTIEYTKSGIEHYDSLLFYIVDDFSLETYEKLDEGIREEQKLYLTRENLPCKIYGVHRDKRLEEITF